MQFHIGKTINERSTKIKRYHLKPDWSSGLAKLMESQTSTQLQKKA